MVTVTNSAELNAAIAATEAQIVCETGTYVVSAVPTYNCLLTMRVGAILTGAIENFCLGHPGAMAHLVYEGATIPEDYNP